MFKAARLKSRIKKGRDLAMGKIWDLLKKQFRKESNKLLSLCPVWLSKSSGNNRTSLPILKHFYNILVAKHKAGILLSFFFFFF